MLKHINRSMSVGPAGQEGGPRPRELDGAWACVKYFDAKTIWPETLVSRQVWVMGPQSQAESLAECMDNSGVSPRQLVTIKSDFGACCADYRVHGVAEPYFDLTVGGRPSVPAEEGKTELHLPFTFLICCAQ